MKSARSKAFELANSQTKKAANRQKKYRYVGLYPKEYKKWDVVTSLGKFEAGPQFNDYRKNE